MNTTESAISILATSRQKLTGREMLVCEYFADEGEYPSTPPDATESNGAIMQRLETEFSREIGNHIDECNRAASRQAVAAHNRLHPQPA